MRRSTSTTRPILPTTWSSSSAPPPSFFQPFYQFRLRQRPNGWGVRASCKDWCLLFCPCFPKAWTEISAFTITDSFSLILKNRYITSSTFWKQYLWLEWQPTHPTLSHTLNPTSLRQRQGHITCPSHWYLDFISNFLRHCFITICSDIPVFIPDTTSTHTIISQQLLSRAPFLLFPRTSICNLVYNNTPSQDHHLPPVQTLCSTADSHFSSICPTLVFHLSYR